MNSKFSALASLTLLLAMVLASGCTSQNQANASGSVEKVRIVFEISANDNTERIAVIAEKGSNAFELMKQNLQVEFKDSAMGPFITGINGIKADSEHYWALHVNGAYAQKGISQYSLEKDSTIAWKLEKIDFSKFS